MPLYVLPCHNVKLQTWNADVMKCPKKGLKSSTLSFKRISTASFYFRQRKENRRHLMSSILSLFYLLITSNYLSYLVKKGRFGFAYLAPKRRVDRVSAAFEGLGEQQHSNAVLEFPPYKIRTRSLSIQIVLQKTVL